MLRRWRSWCAPAALTMAAVVAAAAHAQTFTPARDELVSARVVTMESAEAWAEEFFALNPEVASFELIGPGHIVVTSASGAQVDVYLDNLIDRLSVRGAERARVLADYEASFYDALAMAQAQAAGQPEALPENVMPIVRHRDFRDAMIEQAGGQEAAGLVHRDLAGDVVVLLAYDTPMSIAVMSKGSLGLADMTDEEALALAKGNLARRAAGLEWRADGGLRVALLDGSYESSLLLLDHIWDELEADLGGEIAVAVPLRGLLVAARADHPDDVAALRALITQAMFDPYAVSEEVLVRREGRWEVLP